MANYEATRYDFYGANLTGIEGTATGTILPWSSASVPTGFLECNGQAVSRSTYSALFAVISTTYRTGDGSSTFNLPNLSDNVPIGKSPGKALATTGGSNTVTPTGNVGGSTANATLSTAQLASHSHTSMRATGPYGYILNTGPGNNNRLDGDNSTANAGSGTGHSHNMSANFSGDATSVVQPYLTILYIIKT